MYPFHPPTPVAPDATSMFQQQPALLQQPHRPRNNRPHRYSSFRCNNSHRWHSSSQRRCNNNHWCNSHQQRCSNSHHWCSSSRQRCNNSNHWCNSRQQLCNNNLHWYNSRQPRCHNSHYRYSRHRHNNSCPIITCPCRACNIISALHNRWAKHFNPHRHNNR